MRQALRSIYLWCAVAALTAAMYFVGLPLFLVTMPFDRTRAIGHWYAQRWGRLVLKLNDRWSTEVLRADRIPSGKPFVVVANHQGMGDIMLVFCLDLHFKWISKAINFYVPCMGWFMFHAGYIPLVRGKKSSIEKCMARSRDYLAMGVSVLFFPEGTRSRNGGIGPFKSGAFRLAVDTGCDILPLAIAGTANALPKDSWRFSNERAPMKLLVGEVISTRGYAVENLDDLIAHTRDQIIALKDELDGRAYAAPLRASA
jgi:1-acyl-sn-glycerol-3-phosphate acyltransferase